MKSLLLRLCVRLADHIGYSPLCVGEGGCSPGAVYAAYLGWSERLKVPESSCGPP